MDEFINHVRQRLARGATEIGLAEMRSGDPRSVRDLVHEIDEELLDVAAWAAVTYQRLGRLRELAARADQAERDEDDGA